MYSSNSAYVRGGGGGGGVKNPEKNCNTSVLCDVHDPLLIRTTDITTNDAVREKF